MGQRRRLPEFDQPEWVELVDLQQWMNTQRRRPGAEPVAYNHRQVVAILKEYDVPLARKSEKPGAQVIFRLSDLRRQAPILAAAFERGATTAAAAQDAVEA